MVTEMVKKEFKLIKLSDLIPYENNPRKNDDAAIEVAKSISEIENLDPIEVDEGNVILSGHTRLKALQQQNYESNYIYPVLFNGGEKMGMPEIIAEGKTDKENS